MRTPESGVDDTGVAGSGGGAERRLRLPRPAGLQAFAWPAGIVAAAVVLFVCYLRLSMTEAVSSDGASNALQAWDMLHGNPLLRGWTLTDVSFYPTELPQYMGVELVRGLGPDVVHNAAAMSYALLVLLAGFLAKGREPGREGLLRLGIAAGIMLAPQPGPGAFILLLAPDHTGTQVPVLVAWLVLDRAPRRAWVPAAIGVLLAWVLVADRIALIVAVVPLALACAVRAFHGLAVRREPLRSRWYELSLAAAAVLSVPVALLAVGLIRSAGGYSLQPVITALSGIGQLPARGWVMVRGVLALFGADFVHLPLGMAAVIAVLHLAGVALAVAAVGVGVRRFLTCDLLVAVLTAAVLVNLGGYVVSTLAVTDWSTRQIAGVLPAGAVLAGRLLAGRVRAVRLVPVLTAVLLCYAAALGYGITRPALPAVGQDLAGWLSSHHLSYGLSGYGFANTTTLASGGRVALRPATWRPAEVTPGPEEFDLSWYDKRRHYANFVVMAVVPGKFDPMTYPEVRRIFGAPARTYHVGQYIIVTWHKNLLDEVRSAASVLNRHVHTGRLPDAAALEDGTGHPAAPRFRVPRRWMAAAAWLAAVAAAFIVNLQLARTRAVNSDGAGNALQAWDMLHGNLLLRGWTLSDVSFYTTELPQYVLVELVRGLHQDVVQVAAAMTYTLAMLLAALLAKGTSTGREAVVRAGIAAGIMLAPQLDSGTNILLSSPDHIGTSVPVMAVWLILDRARPRWYVPVITAAMLGWAAVADELVLYIGVLPLALVCAVRVYRATVIQRQPVASQWYDIALGAGALIGAAAAALALHVIRALGGFAVLAPSTQFAQGGAVLPRNLGITAEGLLLLGGADFLGGRMGISTAIAMLHVAGVVLAGWGTCLAARRFGRDRDLIAQVLAVAVVVNLLTYVLSTHPSSITGTREIDAVLPFSAALAGRLLASRLMTARLVPVLALVLLGYLGGLGREISQPAVPAQNQQLASWLAAHHLRTGLAGYWESNVVTLTSGGQVQIRAVRTTSGGMLAPGSYESDADWFNPGRNTASFVVTFPGIPGYPGLTATQAALATFGAPARTYHVGAYTVLVWDTNLLADLR